MGGIATYEQLVKPSARFMSLFMDFWIEEILFFSANDTERLLQNLVDQSILQPNTHPSVPSAGQTATDSDIDTQLDTDKSEVSADLQEGMRRMIQLKAAKLMMSKLGMHDFSLMDIQRPDSKRLICISSAIINFIRFRDSALESWGEKIAEWEARDNELKELEAQITSSANELVRLRQLLELRTESDALVHTETPISSQDALEISRDLANLGNANYSQNPRWLRTQELNNRLRAELERLIELSKTRVKECNALKDVGAEKSQKTAGLKKLTSNLERDTKRLQEYSEKDPADISKVTDQLKASLRSNEDELRALEATERNMTKTIQSLQQIDTELRKLTELANSIVKDATSLDISKDNVARSKDDLETLKHKVEMAKNQKERLRHQSEMSKERLFNLRKEMETQEEEGHKKQAALIAESNKLTEEKSKAQTVIESIKAESDEIISQMDRVERHFLWEYDEANVELANINALVRDYITEIRSLLL